MGSLPLAHNAQHSLVFIMCYVNSWHDAKTMKAYTLYQELMKEGASNCVERHLTIATLPFYGHILKWGISVVFIANALRRTPRVRVIPRALRRRTYVYIRRWRVAIVNYDSRSQRWSRKGKARSKGSESGKPRRHIGLQKDLGYSRRSFEVRPCLAPRK